MSITDCTRPACRAAVFYVLYKCSQVPVLLSDATEVSSFVTIGRCYLVVSKAGAKLHHTLYVWAGQAALCPSAGTGPEVCCAKWECFRSWAAWGQNLKYTLVGCWWCLSQSCSDCILPFCLYASHLVVFNSVGKVLPKALMLFLQSLNFLRTPAISFL